MLARRSSRLAQVPNLRKPANYHEDNSDVDEPGDTVKTRPRKRRQRANDEDRDVSMPKPRVKRGKTKAKLALLPTMPLDVLYAIFGHLPPHDLLRLSRTNKSFRSLLLNRSARTVWKDALARDPHLPKCPEDMTEIRYAHLVFEHICHLCGAPNVRDVIWEHRMRVCQKCYQAEVGKLFIRKEWSEQYDEVEPYLVWAPGPGSHHWTMSFLSTDLEKFESTLRSIAGDESAQERFKEERKEIVARIKEHAVECSSWVANLRNEQSEEKQDLRIKRKEDIEARLLDLGYGRELEWLRSMDAPWPMSEIFDNHKLVRKAQALTNRIWSNIREPIVEVMEQARERRLVHKRSVTIARRGNLLRNLLQQYALEQSEERDRILPNVGDLYLRSQVFRHIIETPLSDDEEDTVTERTFTDALPHLPGVIEEWRREETLKLAALLPRADRDTADKAGNLSIISSLPDGLARLELATSLFTCSHCHLCEVFHYTNILAHTCDVDVPLHAYCSSAYESLGSYPHGLEDGPRVTFDRVSSRAAQVVIELCGMDPATATFKDMDERDARFTCTCYQCVKRLRVMQGMNWRQAVAHARTSGRREPRLQLLSPEHTTKVKQLEAEAEPPHLEMMGYVCNATRAWTCTRCRKPKLAARAIVAHMKSEHDVDRGDITAADYTPDLDRFVPALECKDLGEAGIFLDIPDDAPFVSIRDELEGYMMAMDMYYDDPPFGFPFFDSDSDGDHFAYDDSDSW